MRIRGACAPPDPNGSEALNRGLGTRAAPRPFPFLLEWVEPVCKPSSVLQAAAAIPLGPGSLQGSSNQPAPGADHAMWGLFDLAPGGVFPAPCHCWMGGALLPHLFTLACKQAVCFLWHCSWACAPQALPGTLSYGARTFLPRRPYARRHASAAAAARPARRHYTGAAADFSHWR